MATTAYSELNLAEKLLLPTRMQAWGWTSPCSRPERAQRRPPGSVLWLSQGDLGP